MPGGQVLHVAGQVGVPNVPGHGQHGIQAHEEYWGVKATPVQVFYESMNTINRNVFTLSKAKVCCALLPSGMLLDTPTVEEYCDQVSQYQASYDTLARLPAVYLLLVYSCVVAGGSGFLLSMVELLLLFLIVDDREPWNCWLGDHLSLYLVQTSPLAWSRIG